MRNNVSNVLIASDNRPDHFVHELFMFFPTISRLIRIFGDRQAILLCALISRQATNTSKDGWFTVTHEELEMDTMQSFTIQSRVMKELEHFHYIERKRIGMPARTYYKIDTQVLFDTYRGIYEK